MRKSLEQVQFDVGKRRLENPKLKQEKLIMQTEQVIFEYGKLQLNFLAQNQQLQQMAQALAEANKKAGGKHTGRCRRRSQGRPTAKGHHGTVERCTGR